MMARKTGSPNFTLAIAVSLMLWFAVISLLRWVVGRG